MPLDNDVKVLIQITVKEAVQEAMRDHCKFPDESVKTLKHLSYALEDIGKGDHRKGVEFIKDQSKFISGLMKTRNRLGNLVLTVMITVILGGFLAWISTAVLKTIRGA